ncbi:MAG TPA: cupin domain-containing protein [Allosphingosinicella sp.]
MDRPELIRAADAAAREGTHSHPWNPNSEMHGVQLGRMAGLKRTGVNLARIPPGKESFVYHSHAREEEWLYILSGTGTAEIDGADYAVGPGDFMGFAAPSVAHHLRNSGEEELVYLMGGENLDAEVATFPKLGKKMVRVGDQVEVYEVADAKGFGPPA